MPVTEFRILSQLTIAVLCMLPVGLLLLAPQRRLALAQGPATAGAYQLGWADFVASLMLCGFLALIQFGGKWEELAQVEVPKGPVKSISAGVLLVNLIVIQGMPLGIAWAWFHLRQTSLAQVFGLRRYGLPESLGMAAMMIVPAGAIAMLGLVLGSMILKHLGWPIQEQEAVAMLKSQQSPLVTLLLILGGCVGAPIVEEVLFRGFLYGSLRRLTNKWFATVFSGLLFGVIHMHLVSLPGLCLLGCFFAVAYEVTGSLLVCILMHCLFNLINTIMACSAHAS